MDQSRHPEAGEKRVSEEWERDHEGRNESRRFRRERRGGIGQTGDRSNARKAAKEMKNSVSERFRAKGRKSRSQPERQGGGAENEGEDEGMGGHRLPGSTM